MIDMVIRSFIIWGVRFAVLMAACFTMRYILLDELGYRIQIQQLLLGGLLIITTVRIWMPWTPPIEEEKRSFDDVSGP